MRETVVAPGGEGAEVAGAGDAAGPRQGGAPPAGHSAARGRAFDRTIVEGPIIPAVWKLAWPTMLQNVVGGLQGMVDHAMVGHFVGYAGNAAIGVSWQIYLVVIVFISSLFTGMGVMVARFAGAGDAATVNRTVYQAFLAACIIGFVILAPLGYVLAPYLLTIAKATPGVQAEALPYLRIMFLGNFGMLFFFMLGGALRAAGDARTPLRLGVALTILNLILNVILIPGLGPVPAFGTAGAALGTVLASAVTGAVAIAALWRDSWVVSFRSNGGWAPDWQVIRALFRFGLPAGIQGVVMNVAGVLLFRFIGSLKQSAEAQAAYSVAYTQVFSLVTWTAVGLMGATAAVVGQNLGAGRPERAIQAVRMASLIGVGGAASLGVVFITGADALLGVFGMTEPVVTALGEELLRILGVSGLFVTVALVYTGGLQGTGDTRSPLYISIVSQIIVPLGLCAVLDATVGLRPVDIWIAILLGHLSRAGLSVVRFRQGKWRHIVVDIEAAR